MALGNFKTSASPVTAGRVGFDLLMGDVVYAPCGHTFSYALDHSLEAHQASKRAGAPVPSVHPAGRDLFDMPEPVVARRHGHLWGLRSVS